MALDRYIKFTSGNVKEAVKKVLEFRNYHFLFLRSFSTGSAE